MLQNTTTTPSNNSNFCPHSEFRSHVDVTRHIQTTDGVSKTSYSITLKVNCSLCGHQMKFPMSNGSLSEEAVSTMLV